MLREKVRTSFTSMACDNSEMDLVTVIDINFINRELYKY